MSSSMQINVDSGEVRKLRQLIDGLPTEIRQKAMHRAIGRVRQMAKTQIVRRSAEKVNLQQKYVRKAVSTSLASKGDSSMEFLIRSGWVRLYEMDPQAAEAGLSVRFPTARASFRRAFIAKIKRDVAVFQRDERGDGSLVPRGPVHELFAANVANATHRDEDYFVKVLTDIIAERLQPRLMHEIENLLRVK